MTDITTSDQQTAFALLNVSGPDSERLLQGQLTCDVSKMDEAHWTLGACCTPKGRMIANFLIARHGNGYLLRLPSSQAEVLKTHLGKYAVFYKAELSILDAYVTFTGNDVTNERAIERAIIWNSENFPAATLHWPDGRTEYWATQAKGETLTAEDVALMDVNAGIAWVTAPTKESWIPQHIGWDKLEGISFKKGCYTGQEVVARLQYLGKSKRHLVLIESGATAQLSPGTTVESEGKNIGEIASWSGTTGLMISSATSLELPLIANGIELKSVKLLHQEEAVAS